MIHPSHLNFIIFIFQSFSSISSPLYTFHLSVINATSSSAKSNFLATPSIAELLLGLSLCSGCKQPKSFRSSLSNGKLDNRYVTPVLKNFLISKSALFCFPESRFPNTCLVESPIIISLSDKWFCSSPYFTSFRSCPVLFWYTDALTYLPIIT